MNRTDLACLIDHSLLRPDSSEKEILAGADVVRQWGIGFFCVQPCFVSLAAGALGDSRAQVVSVVGFPHGCDRSSVKSLAAELAVRDGAREVDMVMNIGRLKSGRSQ
ncbi:MAG TPA: 2-deoxyribose-5-phosphate aldolase, partial [Candidatus Methylomirabilis sp.]|nr:2-deoxyribose-5-phosphate aldolase [Candidatus Methylomirabilis sp.]